MIIPVKDKKPVFIRFDGTEMKQLDIDGLEPAENYIVADLNGAGESLLISNTDNP